MAGPIEAKRQHDRQRGWYPRISVRPDGVYVTEFYLVDTDDPHLSIFAMGLPTLGSAHDNHQNSFLVSLDPDPIGGRDSASTRGFHIVRAIYEPPKPNNFDAIAVVGDKFSEIRPTTEQAQVRFAFDGTKVPQTAKEADKVELVVVAYHSNTAWLQAWAAIKNKINSNSVMIPEVLNCPGSGFTAGPRQLLMRAPRISPVKPGLMRVEFPMAYAPTDGHKFQWKNEDADGNPVGPIQMADLQGEAAYPAAGVLW